MKLYMKQNSEQQLQLFIAESDKYFNVIRKSSVQDIRPKKVAN